MLILDGAKCHIDFAIADEAEKLDIVLLCLPSNTTHELQPFDKCVYRAVEYAWDDEVSEFWELTQTVKLDKIDFCKIFTKVFHRAVTAANVRSGFEACGVYPYNPSRIPQEAFLPSIPTFQPDESVGISNPSDEVAGRDTPTTFTNSTPLSTAVSHSNSSTSPVPSSSTSSSTVPSSSTFHDTLVTPDMKKKNDGKKPRAKAVNYKAVRLQKSLFQNESASSDGDSSDESEEFQSILPEESQEDVIPEVNLLPLKPKKGDFVIAFIIFNFGTKKEMKKYYVGRVEKMRVGRSKKQIEIDFLRRIPSVHEGDESGFSFPNTRDVWKVDEENVEEVLPKPTEKRGRFFFNVKTMQCTESLN